MKRYFYINKNNNQVLRLLGNFKFTEKEFKQLIAITGFKEETYERVELP